MNQPDPARHAFVLGHPISHSRSPRLHTYWLKTLGITGTYEPIDLEPEGLPAFFTRVRNGEFAGGNVTIPLKEHIAALCDNVDDAATKIGAINTLVQRDGGISGSNSDHYGFLANLDQHAPEWDSQTDHAIVLGAGGASRAIIYALQQRGLKKISLLNRTVSRAEALAIKFGASIDPGPLEDFAVRAKTAGLVVNTSAIGMHDTAFDGLNFKNLPATALVTDLVYTPILTPLLRDAAKIGLKTVDGLGMLLHQAVPGFEHWFGQRPEVTDGLRQHIEQDL